MLRLYKSSQIFVQMCQSRVYISRVRDRWILDKQLS